MTHFWSGFLKKAAESPSVISEWLSEESGKNKELKEHKKEDHVDPRDLSEWITPDVWYSSWPTKGSL